MVSSTSVFHEKAIRLSETSVRSPSCIYGQQKKELEDLVALSEHNLTVRINKVWGVAAGLVNSWHQALREGNSIEAFHDLDVAPLHIDSACRYLVQAIADSYKGVNHVSTDTQTSYYEVAKRLCQSMGLDPGHFVVPVSCKEDTRVIYRPARAALDCEEPQSSVLSLDGELASIISDETDWHLLERRDQR